MLAAKKILIRDRKNKWIYMTEVDNPANGVEIRSTRAQSLTIYHLLLTTYYLLLTSYFSLLTSYYLPLTVSPSTDYRPLSTVYFVIIIAASCPLARAASTVPPASPA
jgi:hypothetical protein